MPGKRDLTLCRSPFAKRYGGHADSAGHAGNGADIRPEHCGGGHGGCLLYVGGSHNDACCGRTVRSVRRMAVLLPALMVFAGGGILCLFAESWRDVLICRVIPRDWCWPAWRALHHPCGGYGG